MVAGLLLTGGASRRLGRDKAEIVVAGERLADRAARVLSAVCMPALEIGPGVTGLEALREQPAGSGPLAALVAGGTALRARGHTGHIVLLAVDLPFVGPPLLRLLADWPGDATVVPIAGGTRQSCCARYAPVAVEVARALLADGERSLRALLETVPIDEVPESVWLDVANANAFADLDAPEDLERYGIAPDG